MRLIDADKLYKYIDDEKYPTDTFAEVEDILDIITEQPSVFYLPNNATNGDMIKTVFPNARVRDIFPLKDDEVYYIFIDKVKGCSAEMSVLKSWWNAPYKESEE